MKQSHNNIRPLFISLSVLLFLSLTGCWSSHEIEEQSLGIGLAFDKAKQSSIEKKFNEQGEGYSKNKDLITSTYQLITPQVASSTTKQAGPQQKSYDNFSQTGDSVLQMTRELSLRSEQPLTAHHMKVIVISEKLAKSYVLEQVLDLNFRDNDFSPSCLVLISKGRASKTLETKKAGEIPAFRLVGIVENTFRTTYYDSKNDIVLYQRFHSTKIPEARVVRNEDNVFGFYLPNIQKWLTYEEGVKNYALKPSYSIHQPTLDYKGYVELQVPKNEVVFYPFIDYLYKNWGVENVRMREQDSSVLLFIRAGERPLMPEMISIADILPYLINGEMHHEDDTLILRSPNRKTSFELPIELLETISELAEQERISISKWVEQKLSLIIN
ncbi:Ger(x)C family spore germination protein [Peribacillus simplex]|uniref:Ger(x)C family spore germination protein n=1 Tax=Peribacillus simplex TaxID=1478 RepID=UPI003CFDA2A1